MKDISLTLAPYEDKISLDVTNLEDYDVILGKPWLTRLNPYIDWKRNTIRIRHKRRFLKLKASVTPENKSI